MYEVTVTVIKAQFVSAVMMLAWWLYAKKAQIPVDACVLIADNVCELQSVNWKLINTLQICVCSKGKGFPSSHTCYRALGPELIPARTWLHVIHPAVGCHYFLPGLQLPSQLHSITAPWPVQSYTAWWQRHIGVNNLPKVVMQLCPE